MNASMRIAWARWVEPRDKHASAGGELLLQIAVGLSAQSRVRS